MSGPYIRDDLTATRDGIPDPIVEIECWLDRLEDVLDDVGNQVTADVPAPQEAYDMLALWAKLSRARPELIERCGGTEEFDRVGAILEIEGHTIAERALTVLNPPAWLDAARAFDVSLDDLLDPAAESEQAVELLEDLDEAELALAAAWRFGVTDHETEGFVEQCVTWLCQNTDSFLAASVYVQALGMSTRPDLEDRDYGLAATMLKYMNMLDAAAGAEADLTLANIEPLPTHVVKGLVEHYLQERHAAAMLAAAWLCHRLRRFRPAFAGASTDEEVHVQRWVWTEPDGEVYARLVVPDPAICGPDEKSPLAFFHSTDDSPATEFAGRIVSLANLQTTIEESASVPFTVGQLAEAGPALTLHIGPDRQEWPLLESSVTIDPESVE